MNRRRACAVALSSLSALLLAACPAKQDAPPVKKDPFVPPADLTRPADEPPPAVRFTDVTAATGIAFVHETGAAGAKLLPETVGSGCALFDHEGDGDADILLLSGRSWDPKAPASSTVRLWRNEGGWKFTEVTAEAGLGGIGVYAMGAAVADADGDGDSDVVVTGLHGYLLLRNDGGRFAVLGGERTGLDPGTWKDDTGDAHGPFVTSAAWLDFDRDGRPDLFGCHYVHWSEATDIYASIDGRNKTYATPNVYAGESCRLWRNLGPDPDGTPRFADATDAAKIRNPEGKSLGVAVMDLNDDGWPDIAVANDTQPNYMYCNKGDGTFEECGQRTGIAFGPDGRARAGMGIDSTASPPSAGAPPRVSIAIGNFSGEPAACFEWLGVTFRDRAAQAGIAGPTIPSLTFGVRFLDIDLDGRQDLVLANGHIEPLIQTVHSDISYRQSAQFLRQLPGRKFADVTAHLGADAGVPRVHRGLAAADLDQDGDLDLVLTVNGGAPAILRCDLDGAARKSLRVRVHGAAPATDALGAKVVVEGGPEPQTQWVRSGGSYLSESERVLTFGLGGVESARVTVTWPDGHTKSIDGARPGVLDVSR